MEVSYSPLLYSEKKAVCVKMTVTTETLGHEGQHQDKATQPVSGKTGGKL